MIKILANIDVSLANKYENMYDLLNSLTNLKEDLDKFQSSRFIGALSEDECQCFNTFLKHLEIIINKYEIKYNDVKEEFVENMKSCHFFIGS